MSAIAGVLRLDNSAADLADQHIARRMLDTMAHRGAASGIWQSHQVTLAWRARTPDRDATASAPVTSRDHRFAITCDGRIDNRDDMRRQLQLTRIATDDELFAEGLSQLDLDVFKTLVADFAIAAWDARLRRLVLARDALGVRSLYWARHDDRVWWASELQAMLVPPWYSPRVCEGHLAEYLAASPTDLRETPYVGIERLPQAHLAIMDRSSVRTQAYWHPPISEGSPRGDQQFADELCHALDVAVRARMSEGPGRVGCHLSGGLDSSSVVALARAAVGRERPLKTYSLVFPGLPSADETPYIDAMAQHAGTLSRRVDPRAASGAEYVAQIARHRDLPDSDNGETLLAPLFRLAHQDGLTALLTGTGGDQWLTGNVFRLADDVRRGRVGALVRATTHGSGGVARGWSQMLSAALLPNVPLAVKRLARPLADAYRRPKWILPAFAKRVHLADRLRVHGARGAAGTSASMRESIARVWSGERAFYNDHLARTSAWWGIELRHPFFDRRVVDYVVALPDEQRCRDGRTKDVLRRAIGSLLPPLIRDRTTKGDMSDLMPFAIEALHPDDWLRAPRVAEIGWVDAARVRAMLQDVRRWFDGGPPRLELRDPIWNVLGVELWLRQEAFV